MPTNFTSVGIKSNLVVGTLATIATAVITTLTLTTGNITTANITTLRVTGTASGDTLTIQKVLSGALVPTFSEAGDRRNKAVCFGTGGKLGQCMTAVTAAGVCSCLIP